MKRIAGLLALALIGSAARAEEAKAEVKKDPNDVKIETQRKRNGHSEKTKVESKARRRVGGGTISTTETTHERDHAKKKTTETVERDANGNIVRHEKKVQH